MRDAATSGQGKTTMNTFAEDADFLTEHTDLIVLDACAPALVAAAPGW